MEAAQADYAAERDEREADVDQRRRRHLERLQEVLLVQRACARECLTERQGTASALAHHTATAKLGGERSVRVCVCAPCAAMWRKGEGRSRKRGAQGEHVDVDEDEDEAAAKSAECVAVSGATGSAAGGSGEEALSGGSRQQARSKGLTPCRMRASARVRERQRQAAGKRKRGAARRGARREEARLDVHTHRAQRRHVQSCNKH